MSGIQSSWDPSGDQLNFSDDFDRRFTDQGLIKTAQKNFWDLVIDGIREHRTPNKKKLSHDGYCDFLISYIGWAIHQESPRQQHELLRRLQNNFSEFALLAMEVPPVQALLYEIYLDEHADKKPELITVLFTINVSLARIVDERTQSRGIKRIVEIITGKGPAPLIGYDEKTEAPTLLLEVKQDQLLLAGPKNAVGEVAAKPAEPRYPGEVFDPLILAYNTDYFVGCNFDIVPDLERAIAKKTVTEMIGQLYTTIVFMADGQRNAYLTSTDKSIRQALKRFREPKRMDIASLNIFGNLLIFTIEQDRKKCGRGGAIETAIVSGINGLADKNKKLFGDLAWEYFASISSAGKFQQPEASPVQRPSVKPSVITATPPAFVPPAEMNDEKWEESLQTMDPFDRLDLILQSKRINLARISQNDNFAREIISLILCGKKSPAQEEIQRGYLAWQKSSHTDMRSKKDSDGNVISVDDDLSQLARVINVINALAQRSEFICEEAGKAVTELFQLFKLISETHSVLVVPREGRKLIMVGEKSLSDVIRRAGYSQAGSRVIVDGQLIAPSDAAKTMISAGQLVEIVIFK